MGKEGEGEGASKSRNMNRGLIGMDNGVGIDCRGCGGRGRGEQRGKTWDNCNSTIIKNKIKTIFCILKIK